jgi:hypothetical protein
MATGTVGDRKGYNSMTATAEFAFKNLGHGDRVCSRSHQKNTWMTVSAIQPKGMRVMRVDNVGEIPYDLKHDIEIDRRHRHQARLQGIFGFDNPVFDCGDPVDIPHFRFGKIIKGQRMFLFLLL